MERRAYHITKILIATVIALVSGNNQAKATEHVVTWDKNSLTTSTTWVFGKQDDNADKQKNIDISEKSFNSNETAWTVDGLTLYYRLFSNVNDFIRKNDDNFGYFNGSSSTTGRYFKFTAPFNGTLEVKYKSANNDKYSAIATEVVTNETKATVEADSRVLSTSGTNGTFTYSASVTKGTTYYIYNGNGNGYYYYIKYTYDDASAYLSISGQPAGGIYGQNVKATPLSVTASASEGSINYQWYSNTTDNNSGGTLISGATNSIYTPSTTATGIKYYYCQLTDKDGGQLVTSTAKINVLENRSYTEAIDKTHSTTNDFVGIAITSEGNLYPGVISGNGIRMRINQNSNRWVFKVNTGLRVTGIKIVSYRDGQEFKLTSLTVDGGTNLLSNEINVCSGDAYSVRLDKTDLSAKEQIICTFSGKDWINAYVIFTYEPLYNKTVTFDANGHGTCATASLTQEDPDANITLPAVTLSEEEEKAYAFTGWYTSAVEGTGKFIGMAGDTYKPTDNITLYAHYVERVASGSVIGSRDKVVDYGVAFSPYATLKKGETYQFSFNVYGNTGEEKTRTRDNAQGLGSWFLTAVNAAGTELARMQADAYYWTTAASAAGETTKTEAGTDGGIWSNYIAAMSTGIGGTVEVSFDGKTLHFNSVQFADGSNYIIYFPDIELYTEETESVLLAFSVENAYLDNYTPVKTVGVMNYVVNAVDGSGNVLKQIVSGEYSTTSGSVSDYYWPRYVLEETTRTLWEKTNNTASGSNYYQYPAFTPDRDGYAENITYTRTDIKNVVFFREAEDIDGFKDNIYTGGNVKARKSQGMVARTGSEYVKLTPTPLTPGIYNITVNALTGSGTDEHCYFKIGDKIVYDCELVHTIGSNGNPSGNNFAGGTSGDFEVTTEADIYVLADLRSDSGIDYIYITKDPGTKLQSVVVNKHSLTEASGTYSYSIGNAYKETTIPVTITPKDPEATVTAAGTTGAAGETITVNATIGTPLAVTVTAFDGVSTANYTVNVARAADITTVEEYTAEGSAHVTAWRYSVAQGDYYEGQQIKRDGVITAWISPTAGGTGQQTLNTNYINPTLTGAEGQTYQYYFMCASGLNPSQTGTGLPTSGMYYGFTPEKSGVLEVALNLGVERPLFVTDGTRRFKPNGIDYRVYKAGEDGTEEEATLTNSSGDNWLLRSTANGGTYTADTSVPVTARIPVTAGKTYYVFASSTKVGMFGFQLLYQEIESIEVSGAESVPYHGTTTLNATVLPAHATDPTVAWTSDNTTIATVNATTGEVRGATVGTANITATATDGSGKASAARAIEVTAVDLHYKVSAYDKDGKFIKVLEQGTQLSGTTINLYVPKFVKVGTTLLVTGDQVFVSNNYYLCSFTLEEDNQEVKVIYGKNAKNGSTTNMTIENVVFYAEAEQDAENKYGEDEIIEKFTSVGAKNNATRLSGGLGAKFTDNEYHKFTTLKPGSYTIYVQYYNDSGSTEQNIDFKLEGNETPIFSIASSATGNNIGQTSDEFDITEPTTLYIKTMSNGQGGIDFIYIKQSTVLKVTKDGQTLELNKPTIDNTTYTTVNPTNPGGNHEGAVHNGVEGPFYLIKNADNYVEITFTGATGFSIDAFHANATASRIIQVYLDEDKTVDNLLIAPGDHATTPIISTGTKGQHTVKITGDGGDVYAIDIVFYTEKVIPTLNVSTKTVIVTEKDYISLSLPVGGTYFAEEVENDDSESDPHVKVEFTRKSDGSYYRWADLYVTGIKPTPKDKPVKLTFHAVCPEEDEMYKSGDITIEISVVKAKLYLTFTDKYGKEQYKFNIGDEGIAIPTPLTVTAKDEDKNTVDLSKLNIRYESDFTDVATVDSETGAITLTGKNVFGTAYIKVIAESDYYENAEANYAVTAITGVTWNMATGEYKTTAPKINDTFNLKENSNILLTGTFGGWQRNGGQYTLPDKSGKTDNWNKKVEIDKDKQVDDFSVVRTGNTDAVNEDMYASTFYGVTRYGWFKQPDEDDEGHITATYPFTLPVRGAYMVFEPQVNGTLTIYIDQNGAWNTYKQDVIDNDGNLVSQINGTKKTFPGNVPYQFRPHAFFLVDQDGIPIEKYTNLQVTTRTKITTGIAETWRNEAEETVLENFCTNYGVTKGEQYKCIIDKDADGYYDATNIGNWTEFKEFMSPREQELVEEHWTSGINGAQGVTKLDNGAYLIIDEGLVRYTFHAMAGQTYYIFSNFSKIGFAGCNFVKDEENQPEGELNLSENEKYAPDDIKEAEGKNALPMYETITLDRKFKANQWNTICLPFTMTEREVTENFGAGTVLIILDKVRIDNGHANIFMTYHEIQSILAGYPYLIKPAQDVDHIEVKNKGIDPNQKVLEFTNNGYTSKGVSDFCNPQTFTIDGTEYTASESLPAGDIYLANNTLYFSRGKSLLKGYRSYLRKEPGAAEAKSISFGYYNAWDDEDAEPTQLDLTQMEPEALEALGVTKRAVPKGVFNLSGQRVSDTLVGLPAGIYIMNGRKVVVGR